MFSSLWKCHLVPPHVPPDRAVDLAQHMALAVLELHLGQGPGPVPGALAVNGHLQTSTVNISEINIKMEGNVDDTFTPSPPDKMGSS